MDKIAFVNHRYGLEVTGGSELLCRMLAEHMKDTYQVEVLTTCAIDDTTWVNYYKPGKEQIHGVCVRRFQVQKTRNWDICNQLDSLLENKHTYEAEISWIQGQGPYSPELFTYIHGNYDEYRAVIFMTYLYYTTAMCMLGIPNALFLPTAHDEPSIYLPHYKRVFREHCGFIFNTVEERDLTERIFGIGNLPYEICGIGVCLPDFKQMSDCRNKFGIQYPYLIYARRIAEGKGCGELFQYFLEYKSKYQDDLHLVLIGNKAMEIPNCKYIKYLGFVEEDEKLSLMHNAEALVIASRFESLSIVALESMAAGRPIIVSGQCPVLKGHCVRSGAGFWFHDYDEFEDAYLSVKQDKRKENLFGKKARIYVEENYQWEVIVSKIEKMIGYVPLVQKNLPILYEEKYGVFHEVTPIFGVNSIAVVYAADDKYTDILSVSIQSLLDHTDTDCKYDIVVLSDGISFNHRRILLSMIENMDHVSIRFLEVGYLLDQYAFQFTNTQLSRATFLRLLLPDVMKEYQRILYLDGDTVITTNIAALFQIDMKDQLVAAVEDPHIAAIRKFRENVQEHLRADIGIDDEERYFNAGVLLINLQALRKTYTVKNMMKLAVERKWMWEDQDVLNKLCKKRIYWLPENWNVLWVPDPYLQEIMMTKSSYFRAFYQPFVIHYAAGGMPVKRLDGVYAYEFWKAAKKSPFYESLINKMPHHFQPQPVDIVKQKKVFRYVWQRKMNSAFLYLKAYGYKYTLKMLYYNLIGVCKYGFRNDIALTQYIDKKKQILGK